MYDMVPASVVLMGVFGLLVVACSIARIAVLERRAHRPAVVEAARIPAQRLPTRAGV